MFSLKNPLEAINEVNLDEHTSSRQPLDVLPLRRVDGKPLNIHSPAYVVEPQPLINKIVDTSLLSNSHLVLSDFGAGMLKIQISCSPS